MQVLGGAGYVQDYPLEQIYRDNRLNMIHEGTAGIHAVTLLGRKVQGNHATLLFDHMREAAQVYMYTRARAHTHTHTHRDRKTDTHIHINV
jgi:hypothetical protein